MGEVLPGVPPGSNPLAALRPGARPNPAVLAAIRARYPTPEAFLAATLGKEAAAAALAKQGAGAGLRPIASLAIGAANSDIHMPPAVREQLQRLREDHRKMTLAAAEAARVDDNSSMFKAMLARDMAQKIKELEEKHPAPKMPAGVPGAGLHHVRSGLFRPHGIPPLGMLNSTQLQAMAYEAQQAASGKMEPEVTELAHHFKLAEGPTRTLNEMLKARNNTFEDDIAAMYEILQGANNASQLNDLFMLSLRWLRAGTFNGLTTPNAGVGKAREKYKLDAPSAFKLADALEGRQDPEGDLAKVITHLERSNKPSAMVMKMLKALKNGDAIDECTHAPAIGSYLHKLEVSRSARKSRSRGRGTSRSRGGRSRSRLARIGERVCGNGRARTRSQSGGGSRCQSRGRSRDGRSRDRVNGGDGGHRQSKSRGRGAV